MDDLKQFLTEDEISALRETQAWLRKDASGFKKFMGVTRKPIEYLYKKVPESLRESIAGAILKVLVSVRDGSSKFVEPKRILNEIKDKHGRLKSRADHFQVGVSNLDAIALATIKRSKNACTAEGAAAGVAGLPGIVVDIPALYGLLFGMISQVATTYGFSTDPDEERTHMLKILDIGHQLEPERKKEGMEELVLIQQMIREEKPVQDVQRFAVQKGLQTMARHLGLALTQRKLAQSVVLVGGVVGAGVNRQLAGEVGEVAFHAFRKRHITELAYLREAGEIPMPKGVEKPKQKSSKLPSPPSYS